jgi:hypothetical protein
MAAVHAEVFAERNIRKTSDRITPPSDLPHLDDQVVLDKAFNAKNGDVTYRLYHGDTEGYGSPSEADLGLCSRLAFYTGPKPEQIDRLFRASDLYRRKWDDPRGSSTWGELTILKALEDRDEFYSGNGHSPSGYGEPQGNAPARKEPEPMAEEAFYGLAGKVVNTLLPHTESCREALLIQFLTAFGNVVDRGPHAVAEAAHHGTNLFVVLVGNTSKGRKGSSWEHIKQLFLKSSLGWADSRVMGGLSSGEGLIWAVRDPASKTDPIKEKGRPTGETVTYEVDPGAEDKRLLILEPEFASVLQVMGREKNTLSTMLRQSWDSGTLRTLTKNNPAKATNAHISIIGHITKHELLRCLTETEAANGFGNRFLWLWTKRTKFLPEGGGEVDYDSLAPELTAAIDRAGLLGRLYRDGPAKAAWAEIYEELSQGQPGLFGDMTSRSEAQCLRLSVLYAALDGATAIGYAHLMAALAVWEYAEESTRYIFGDTTGDAIADRILDALSGGEMDRTAIYILFGKNLPAARIAQALAMLQYLGRIRMEKQESEGGRPKEVWFRVGT